MPMYVTPDLSQKWAIVDPERSETASSFIRSGATDHVQPAPVHVFWHVTPLHVCAHLPPSQAKTHVAPAATRPRATAARARRVADRSGRTALRALAGRTRPIAVLSGRARVASAADVLVAADLLLAPTLGDGVVVVTTFGFAPPTATPLPVTLTPGAVTPVGEMTTAASVTAATSSCWPCHSRRARQSR